MKLLSITVWVLVIFGYNTLLKVKILTRKKNFYLGICLEMQILSNCGYENIKAKGLEIIDSDVRNIKTYNNNLKIPYVGWKDVEIINISKLF
jgi:imidazole glycerol-phosphate synthase subunit HisH